MNRILVAFATLLLLSGCATYGDGYYRDRAVYADGAYYYPAYDGEGDYYYGADTGYDYDYTYAYPYGYGFGYTPFWGLDRYRCRSYYGCVPAWGGYYPYYYAPGWSFSLSHSWGWSNWGWYGGYHWHKHHHRYRDDGRTGTRPPTDQGRLTRENRYPMRGDERDVTRRYGEDERYYRRPSPGESGRRTPDPIREDRPAERIQPETARRMPATGNGRPAPRELEGRLGRPAPRDLEERRNRSDRIDPDSARRVPATGLGRPAPREWQGRLGRPAPQDVEPARQAPRRASLPVRPAPANARGPQMRYPAREPRVAPAPRAAPAPRPTPQVRPASQNRTSDQED